MHTYMHMCIHTYAHTHIHCKCRLAVTHISEGSIATPLRESTSPDLRALFPRARTGGGGKAQKRREALDLCLSYKERHHPLFLTPLHPPTPCIPRPSICEYASGRRSETTVHLLSFCPSMYSLYIQNLTTVQILSSCQSMYWLYIHNLTTAHRLSSSTYIFIT